MREVPEPSTFPGTAADEQRTISLDHMAQELAALGAETPTERQVKRIAPWLVSLLIHAGVAMLAVFITWTVSRPAKDDSVLIVADFNALTYEPIAPLAGDEPPPAVQQTFDDRAPVQPLEEFLRDRLAESKANPLDLFAGSAHMGAEDASAALAQFAPQASHEGVRFAGVASSNARDIVYVIDASGSMVAWLKFVIEELERSLEGLVPQQRFAVIFFQRNDAIESPPRGRFIRATPQEKARVLQWIDRTIVPAGRSNPLQALRRAIALEPDVIFVLSTNVTGSGEFEIDQRELLATLDALNPLDARTGRRPVQINCIQFLQHDPLGTLREIARQHGGENGYRFLSETDLNLAPPSP